MFPYVIVKNLSNKIIFEVSRFIKRDFNEIKYLKESLKIKKFYETSVHHNVLRIQKDLIAHNKNYSIIYKDNVVYEGSEGEPLYWRIEVVDSYENFANGIGLWGIYIALLDKSDHDKMLSFSYYMPFFEEFFYCADGEGCFLNDRKIHLFNSSKINLGSGARKFIDRKFGSNVLTVCYCACDRINVAAISQKSFFSKSLARLMMQEVKGCFEEKDDKFIIGNNTAVNLLLQS